MKKQHKGYDAFTLIEMLIVLLVIAVLVFLFVPSLSKQRTTIETRGNDAFTKVIKTQVELYQINEGKSVSYEALLSGRYLTAEQVKKAQSLGIDLNKLDE